MAKVENSLYYLNKMKDVLEHLPDESLIDAYENCIELQGQMMETLLRTPHFGENPEGMRSSFFFAAGMERQVLRTYARFRTEIEKKGDRLESGELLEKGCFFCSRPYLVGKFSIVHTKVSGLLVKVVACPWCVDEIESTGSRSVLYFRKGSEEVHWSKVSHYNPQEDFWKLHDVGALTRLSPGRYIH